MELKGIVRVGDLVKYKRGSALYSVLEVKGSGVLTLYCHSDFSTYTVTPDRLVFVDRIGSPVMYLHALDSLREEDDYYHYHYDRIPYRFKIRASIWDLKKEVVPVSNEIKQETKIIKGVEMKKTINKLNGLALGEENFVELTQDASTEESINISLYSILKESKTIQKLGFGKESLLKGIVLSGENLSLTVSHGNVEREENKALLGALHGLVVNTKSE